MKKNSEQGVRKYSVQKKLLMELKIAVFIILVSVTNLFSIGTYSQSAKVTLEVENVTLEQVMDEIEQQSEFYFIFNQKQIDVNKVVNIHTNDALITEILPKLFAGTNVQYAVMDRKILLSTDNLEDKLLGTAPRAAQQQRQITGAVTDENGAPLLGVNVVVTGTTIGVITDRDGRYTIEVPQDATSLLFTYVGMESQEITIGTLTQINVSMVESIVGLDEVVVVGYGTQKKADLTGSIVSINEDEIQNLTVTNAEQVLLGKLAGVQVKAVSGEPGAAAQIRIRGIGSISAGVDPLYVIDGFPTDDISTLSPNDIESIDVLKDASATAIYGSRGANGVIIVTTKRGKLGETVFSFDASYGLQKALKLPEFMNAQEQAQYYYDGLVNRNLDRGYDISGPEEDWHYPVPKTVLDVVRDGTNTIDRGTFDDVLRTAGQSRYNLSAAGGNESVKYAISGEYINQDGIIIESNYKRYSFRSNIDAKLSDKLSVSLSLNPTFTDEHPVRSTGGSGSANEGIIAQATNSEPYYPLFNEDGSYFIFTPGMDAGPTGYNPVAIAREITNESQGIRLLGNTNATYSFTDNLYLNVMLGASVRSGKSMYFRPNLPVFLGNLATGRDEASFRYNWITEYTLNYNKRFGEHSIVGLLGFTAQKDQYKYNSIESNSYPNNLVPTLSAVSGIITDGTSGGSANSLVSYLGRINYNYGSKYYVTASIRTDGSSRFGSERKYGVFPSAALAWRISEEGFFENASSLINELKLRASYGKTGNNNIGNYEQYATINYVKYILGETVAAGYAPAQLANPDLTWEKQEQYNFGIDISFFKSRVNLNVDHFRSTNTDLLLNVNLPLITGFDNTLMNIGEVENIGWEFVLNTRNIQGNFKWTTDFNISTFKNEVVKLGPEGDPIYEGANVTMIGEPIGMFYGWLTDGIFLSQAEVDEGPIYAPGTNSRSRPGDIRFVDVSGPDGVPDGIIDNLDKTIMGNPYPDFYYGMTNTFSYKNLSLMVNLQGVVGNQIFMSYGNGVLSTRGRIPTRAFLLNYWKSEQDIGDGETVRPNDSPTGNVRGRYSQFWLDEGTYLRINNISLSYVIPDNVVTQRLGVSSVRFYINSNYPFLFTKNMNFNPDVSNSSNPLTPGRDNNDYPIPKSIIFGINLTF